MGAIAVEAVMEAQDGWSTIRLRRSTIDRIQLKKRNMKLKNADEVVVVALDAFEKNGGKGVGDGVQV